MARYVVGEESHSSSEEEEKEEVAEEMKSILEEKMEEAWRQPEGRAMKRKLSKVAKTHWVDQVKEALKTTGYAKELEARAREIKYDEKVKEAWE